MEQVQFSDAGLSRRTPLRPGAGFGVVARDPFHFARLPGSLFETAIQRDAAAGRCHFRTLDRLHLSAMEELGIFRLMSNDTRQAKDATEAGCQVMVPGG